MPDFQAGLVLRKYQNYWRPLRESLVSKCTNLFPNFQRGTSTKKTKKTYQSLKKKDPKLSISRLLGTFGNATAKRLIQFAQKSQYVRGMNVSNFSLLIKH